MKPNGPNNLLNSTEQSKSSGTPFTTHITLHQLDVYSFYCLYLLDLFLFILLLPWTIWNWKLALSGITSVEHTKELFKINKEDLISEYGEQTCESE